MANGGKRPGAGRKKGSKNAKTLEKEAVLAAFRERVMRSADLLFDAQMTLARGQTFLYKLEKEWVQTGRSGFYKKKKPKIVTSTAEIERYLEGDVAEGDADDDQDPTAVYYFLTTKEPFNPAIDSMLDRALGKANQSITGADGGPIEVTVMKYAENSTTPPIRA